MKLKFIIHCIFALLLLSCNSEEVVSDPPIEYADGEFPEKILIRSWVLRSQSQIDDFGAYNYTIMKGTLKISPGPATNNLAFDLTPLRSLERIEKHLIITDNPELSSLEGLHNINLLGKLLIQDNENLINLDGLRNLEVINYVYPGQVNNFESEIWIRNNASLENIDGLKNITSVKDITIANNMSLQNLNGFEGLSDNYYFRTDIGCGSEPYTAPYCGNQNLNNFCGLQNLFLNGNFDYVRINGNAYNPTVQDIIDGNCSQ